MVEIFTAVSGQSGAASRSVSNDVRLTVPSDVYFGSGAAGVAYYEKSGADLKVTLLDGQEVLIRDFFVIGPAGEYSRLRDGGSAGKIEVTGLIAPEPFVPPESSSQTSAPVVDEKPAAAEAVGALNEHETLVEVSVGAAADGVDAGSSAVGGSVAGGGFSFAGMPLDRVIFGASMFPAAAVMIRGSDKDDKSESEPVTPAAGQTTDDLTGTSDDIAASTDPEIADLLAAILGDNNQEADLFSSNDAPAAVAFLGSDEADQLFDTGAGSDILSALVGDLVYMPPEG